MEIRFDINSTDAIVVTCPDATHYKVGIAMLASGLLVDKGFDTLSTIPNAVVLMPKQGIDRTMLLEYLMREIDQLVDRGEIRTS